MNLYKSLVFLVLSSLFFACVEEDNTVENTPEAVTKYWSTNFANYDFEKIIPYSTTGAKDFINWYSKLDSLEKEGGFNPVENLVYNYKILNCEVDGNTAYCAFCCDQEGNGDEVVLLKQNGMWKVDIAMEAEGDAEWDFDEMMEEVSKELELEIEDFNPGIE